MSWSASLVARLLPLSQTRNRPTASQYDIWEGGSLVICVASEIVIFERKIVDIFQLENIRVFIYLH